MRRAAEFRQPLDVGHAPVAGTDLCRDARRHAERIAGEAQHRQRVDLSGLGAFGIDEDDVAPDQFLFQRLDPPGAIFFCIDRRFTSSAVIIVRPEAPAK